MATVQVTRSSSLDETEEVRLRYAAIVELSDDAIISKSLEGVISAWNPAARRIFGYTAVEAIGQSITIIIPLELRAEENEILRRVRTGQHINHYETWRVSKHGRRIDVSVTVFPVRDAKGRIIGVSKIARDITEKKRAEAALRESEEGFRLIANAAPVMVWMSGVDKLWTYFNQGWLEFTGRSVEAELGNGWTEGIHPADLAGCLEICEKAFDRHEPFQREYRLRRSDGEYRWICDHGVPTFSTEGSFAGYIGSAIDVTERKVVEEEISRMSQRLIEAHEDERRWIARELHDDISQKLTVFLLTLERLRLANPPAEVGTGIANLIRLATSLGSDVRALSHRLHSSNLEYLGLQAAASEHCNKLSDQYKVEITFRSGKIPDDLSREVSLCFFRVLQEALQNAIKYSGSRHFQVSLTAGPNGIELTVDDSGNGFDFEDAIKGSGLGLTSMRERLKLVNGTVSVDSQLGRGTTIHAWAPVSPPPTGG